MIRTLLLSLSIIVLSYGSARADDLAKLLDWTFYPNEVIIYSDPSLFTISNGGLHLSAVDQSDNVTNTLNGLGFKKGTATFNTVWDLTQQWLTVGQSLNLPDGSVATSPTAWTDMTGNVLLLHFDTPPVVTLPTVTIGTTAVPVAMMSNADGSTSALTASCIIIPPGYKNAGVTIANIIYCPTHIPNIRVGGALRFDGQEDELLVPNPVPAGTSLVALEGWIYPTLSQVGTIISQGSSNGVPNYELGVAPTTGGLAATFKMANHATVSGGTMLMFTWNHVVGSFDGSTMTLYVNGAQVASKSAPGAVTFSTQELVVGTSWINSSKGTSKAANTSSFSGMIDEVAVYTKALSTQDVGDHYAHQAPISLQDGLQHGVPFAGVFDSRAMTVGSPVSWDTLSWVPAAPYGIQLPDGGGSESGYSMGNNTNMNGNILLLHLNESFGITSFMDTSPAAGQGSNGVCNITIFGLAKTCPKMGQVGKFDKAGTFNGSTDVISVPLSQGQSPTKAITLESWVYPTSNMIDTNVGIGIISKGPQNTSSPGDFELGLSPLTSVSGPGGPKNAFNIYFSLSGHTYTDPMPIPNWPNQVKNYIYGSYISINTWNHLVATYDGSTMKLYLNGVLQMSQIVSGGDVANSNNPVLIGMRSSTGSYPNAACAGGTCYRGTHFPGKIDEVAIYNRAITQTEVTAHYVRGALKTKFQMRICKQTDCSDKVDKKTGLPIFIGPDGSSNTYFTPSVVPLQSTTQTANLTVAKQPSEQTFQYRLFFESPYASFFPSISSVTVDPLHFPTTNPSATVNTQKAFSQITSFDDAVVSNGGEVWYQFSPDNKNWFFCSGASWFNVVDLPIDTNDISQKTSPKAQIQSCLKDTAFVAAGGSGTLWYRAFFHSLNGVESIDLNSVKIGYKDAVAPPPPPPPPPVDGTPKIANPGDLSTSVGKTLAVVIQASIANNNEITYSIVSGEKVGMVFDAKTGLFTWTPTSDQVGNYVVTFRATDSTDATKFNEQGANITVAEVKSVPVQVQPFTLNASEGSELKFNLKKPDASKSYAFTCSSGCPTGLSVDYNTGAVVWTPTYSQAGKYDLQFQIAGDDGVTLQPLQVEVKEVDAVPEIKNPGDKVVTAGETLDFTLTAKDPDGGIPHFEIASPKQEGMSIDANSGVFSWVTKPEQAGSYIVVLRALDNQNPNLYSDQVVIVTVNKSEATSVTGGSVPQPTTPPVSGPTSTTGAEGSAPAPAAASGSSGCSLIR